jgi:hypothetical protein
MNNHLPSLRSLSNLSMAPTIKDAGGMTTWSCSLKTALTLSTLCGIPVAMTVNDLMG